MSFLFADAAGPSKDARIGTAGLGMSNEDISRADLRLYYHQRDT